MANVSDPDDHGTSNNKSIDRLQILSTTINDRFEIIKRLGSGSFGEVFLAKDRRTNLFCALKTERKDCQYPQLHIEQQIFLRMQNCKLVFLRSDQCGVFAILDIGFPSIFSLMEEKDYLILAMDLLGPSIEDLLNFCQRKFSPKTVLMLMDQALTRIQMMHEQSFLHRDVRREINSEKIFERNII